MRTPASRLSGSVKCLWCSRCKVRSNQSTVGFRGFYQLSQGSLSSRDVDKMNRRIIELFCSLKQVERVRVFALLVILNPLGCQLTGGSLVRRRLSPSYRTCRNAQY